MAMGVLGFLADVGRAQDEEAGGALEIKATAGLRYDPPRFVVKPGAKVKIEVENSDDMAHNFVIVAPGARVEIVTAAATMPVTPEQTFLPPSDKILFHTPVLTPGKSAALEFTAPTEPGVYPYVCTFPGHGFVMYGAMYVGKQSEADLPTVADDENLPDIVRDAAKTVKLHDYPETPPYWYRIFMRDCGPAGIAVALPDAQNYCWDAGACRLRYAWRGAFVNPMPQWRTNGDGFAEVLGTVYYRSMPAFPLRFGDPKLVPHDVRFRGYSVVGGLPEFHYEAAGADVRELIKSHPGGFEETFKITGTKASVFFVTDPNSGASIASDAGKFTDGVLKLAAAKAKQFTVSFTEIVNKEPLGYWSMNDVLTDKKPLPVPGVKERALKFDGRKSQFATGLKSEALANGATFCIWAQIQKFKQPEQACIGALAPHGEFALGANLAGVPGYGVVVKNAGAEAKIIAAMPAEADGNWHHLAATLDGKNMRFFFDGRPSGSGPGTLLPVDGEFYLGSSGKRHFANAILDEARIYARVLDPKEIAAIYESERPKTPLPPAPPDPDQASKPDQTPKPESTPAPPPDATPTPKPKPKPKPKPANAASPKPAK
jgi:uncharacterized cupredoxin-like copper-binding protein